MNFFVPSSKLPLKQRSGSKQIKRFNKSKTPFHRVMKYQEVSDKTKTELNRAFINLDPFWLQQKIKEKVLKILKQ